MPTNITGTIDEIVAQYARPTLKTAGFSKSGQRFWSRTPESIWVLEFQRDKYNSGASGSFTINLGVYHPVWAEAVAGISRMSHLGAAKSKPAEQDCFITERLDELYRIPSHLRERGGTWWAVRSGVSLAESGQSVVSAIHDRALPWFETYDPLEQAVRHLDERYSGLRNAWYQKVCAMVGMVLLGEKARAAELYELARSDYSSKGRMDSEFKAWREETGLA